MFKENTEKYSFSYETMPCSASTDLLRGFHPDPLINIAKILQMSFTETNQRSANNADTIAEVDCFGLLFETMIYNLSLWEFSRSSGQNGDIFV
jgi:hypothetical protein